MSNGRSRRVGSLAGLECPLPPPVRGDPSLIAVGSHVSEQSLSGSRTQLDLQLQPRWRDGGWGDAGEESTCQRPHAKASKGEESGLQGRVTWGGRRSSHPRFFSRLAPSCRGHDSIDARHSCQQSLLASHDRLAFRDHRSFFI